MEKMIVTRHVAEERMNRMLFIAENIGWGDIILRWYNAEEDTVECLTNTGVLMIKSADMRILVTAYTCNVDRAFFLYSQYNQRVPEWLVMKIRKNAKIKQKKHFKG